MGLDIYVVRIRDAEKYRQAKKDIKEWEKQMSIEKIVHLDDALDLARKYADKNSNLKVNEDATFVWDVLMIKEELSAIVDELSRIDPDHLFRVGYFRSSYNQGGLNQILDMYFGETLYDAFKSTDEFEFTPDWGFVKEKCEGWIAELKSKKYIAFRTSLIRGRHEELPTNRREALALFEKEIGKKKSYCAYENTLGEFSLNKPLQVSAIMRSQSDNEIFTIQDADLEFYITALEIICETADMALADKDNTYSVHWSA